MKKTVLLVAMVASTASLASAEEKPIANPKKACRVNEAAILFPTVEESPRHDEFVLPQLLAEPARSGIPDCPTVSPCPGGNFTCTSSSSCGPVGRIRLTDTGSTQCNRNGQTLACFIRYDPHQERGLWTLPLLH